jgi:hypothetical protein
MKKDKIKKHNKRIFKMINKIDSATNIRLIINNQEILHDFDQGDAKALAKKAIEICESYLIDEKTGS